LNKTIHRIGQFIEFKGISLNAFDKSIGRPAGYIGKQIRSEASIGSDIVETILRKYEEISPQWLISGEGKMLRSKTGELNEPGEVYSKDYFEETLIKYLHNERVKDEIKNIIKDRGDGEK